MAFTNLILLTILFLELRILKANHLYDSGSINRSPDDCKRLFLKEEDELSREYVQAKLAGGKTARIGSPCNYAEWLDIRQAFLEKVWNRNLTEMEIDPFIQYQTQKAFDTTLDPDIEKIFLERWCISCYGEPLLECAPDNTCICYHKYKVEKNDDPAIANRNLEPTECKIRLGDSCEIFSEIDCETHTYCSNIDYRCKKRWMKNGVGKLEISQMLHFLVIIFLFFHF